MTLTTSTYQQARTKTVSNVMLFYTIRNTYNTVAYKTHLYDTEHTLRHKKEKKLLFIYEFV
jgi:hypothetical protein